MKIKLTPFNKSDFERFISWIDNEDILVTIAGIDFKYPLDIEQLSKYLLEPNSLPLNVVNEENEVIGHSEIIRIGNNTCLLDKIIIGDKTLRGKGLGVILTRTLLDYAFNNLSMNEVELNVYEWNHSAIRCYEKVGFKKNPGKEQITKVGNQNWQYFNMKIDRNSWKNNTTVL